jgi:L-serine dehydratase
MNLSVFDVIGPVMVGPSSSHTAGAARIGLAARRLLGEAPRRVLLGLHGSFAATGLGHATDRALLAGLLGLAPDDALLPRARELAAEAGLLFKFETLELGEMAHPNTARIELEGDEFRLELTGASLGGGIVELRQIDAYATSFRGDLHALICWHEDKGGFLARVTAVLACADLNIATLRTSRRGRGHDALTVIETDGPASAEVIGLLSRADGVRRLRALAPLP